MIYPYLGAKESEKGDNVVIFFTSRNKGVVVMNDNPTDTEYKFGNYGEYNEDDFDFLKEGVCVRLNN